MRFLRERGGRDGRERDRQLDDEERENWNRIKKNEISARRDRPCVIYERREMKVRESSVDRGMGGGMGWDGTRKGGMGMGGMGATRYGDVGVDNVGMEVWVRE